MVVLGQYYEAQYDYHNSRAGYPGNGQDQPDTDKDKASDNPKKFA